MSHPINTIIDENKQEMEAETPNDLKGKEKREYDVQSTLVELSHNIEVVSELGVDRTVFNDVVINSMSRYNLSLLSGAIDSFLRSPNYK